MGLAVALGLVVLLFVLAFAGFGDEFLRARKRRHASELSTDLDRLAQVAPGGTPATTLEVPSPSVVEMRAENVGCHGCGAARVAIKQHGSGTFEGRRLRVLRVACETCGAARDVYVRLMEAN